jgi:hypothetical protein
MLTARQSSLLLPDDLSASARAFPSETTSSADRNRSRMRSRKRLMPRQGLRPAGIIWP